MADITASQSVVLAAGAFPAEAVDVSQGGVMATIEADMAIQIPQTVILIAARGRVTDPQVRAWTFSLDGHDYYVLRLGNQETLIYDTLSEQWYTWGSGDSDLWRAYNGCNWLGGTAQGSGYGSNVVVGDDGNGSVYFLDPDSDFDDDSLVEDTPRAFSRVIQAQVPTKGYNSLRCFGVELQGSIGEISNETYATVTLEISDDRGNTYTDCGAITVANEDYTQRLDWRSLGSITSPGRLFRITDDGALKRVDALEMQEVE